MDKGFYTYAVRGKGSLNEVKELIMHFVVICDDEASFTAAKSVMYGEGLIVAINVFGRLGSVTS